MRVLLDTNIIIHRETDRVINYQVGKLFYWLDELNYDKYVHIDSKQEINRYKDEKVTDSYSIKLDSYKTINSSLEFDQRLKEVSDKYDNNENDIIDTNLLNEVYKGRVDILISEDKKIYTKASALGISEKVFNIQDFLEKVTSENPEFVDYDVLAIRRTTFEHIDVSDPFFDSFKKDYSGFEKWFHSKFDQTCYVCYDEDDLTAFLYIKIEDAGSESYSDIKPIFDQRKRLKIGTLKVESNGYKIGERFLKIVFDNALQYEVEEIYVTIFDRSDEQIQLIEMLKEWGFEKHGIKTNDYGEELVLTRPFGKDKPVFVDEPRKSHPFFSWNTRKYIVKIWPEYHTELFPDSINTREDKSQYLGNQPHRNRISKVYISHSKDRHLQTGDILLVYRMGTTSPKKYSSTITSICIVEGVRDGFKDFDEFYNACARKTLFQKEELRNDWWNKYGSYKPFIINFLYAFSLPTPKPTLHNLNELGVIPDIRNMGRGFIEIDNEKFRRLVNFAYSN